MLGQLIKETGSSSADCDGKCIPARTPAEQGRIITCVQFQN